MLAGPAFPVTNLPPLLCNYPPGIAEAGEPTKGRRPHAQPHRGTCRGKQRLWGLLAHGPLLFHTVSPYSARVVLAEQHCSSILPGIQRGSWLQSIP